MAIQPLLVSQIRGLDSAWVVPPQKRDLQLNPRVARALSVGHLATVVDSLWIRSMLDPAINHVAPGDHPPAYYDLDLASRLDPAFFDVYSAGGLMLAVIRDDDEGSRILVERGEAFRRNELGRQPEILRKRFWPDAWRLPMLLGYIYLFELSDAKAAGGAFAEAARIEGAPEFLTWLANRFARPGGAYEVGGRLLTQMIDLEKDPRARETLVEKRKSLYLGRYLSDLDRQFREFLSRDRSYQEDGKLSATELEGYWERFRRAQKIPLEDPWGGKVSIDASGRVRSTTARIKVFGLD
jgi:hypothetical protein